MRMKKKKKLVKILSQKFREKKKHFVISEEMIELH